MTDICQKVCAATGPVMLRIDAKKACETEDGLVAMMLAYASMCAQCVACAEKRGGLNGFAEQAAEKVRADAATFEAAAESIGDHYYPQTPTEVLFVSEVVNICVAEICEAAGKLAKAGQPQPG